MTTLLCLLFLASLLRLTSPFLSMRFSSPDMVGGFLIIHRDISAGVVDPSIP